MPFEGEGFASIPAKIWPPCPLGSNGPISRSNHQLSLSCEKICVASKMTNRKKSIKICVCVHPPIYSSTTTDHLPSLPPTKIISIIINAD